MTTATAGQRKMTFEIHLPKIVGNRIFKPFWCATLIAGQRIDQVVPTQNRRDRARRTDTHFPKIFQPTLDLATTPGAVLLTQLDHLPLQRRTRSPRTAVL